MSAVIANQHLKPFHKVVKFLFMGAVFFFFKFRSHGDFNNDKRWLVCTFTNPVISLSFILFLSCMLHLQHALNEFSVYCRKWKLNVNVEKTTILVFYKRSNATELVFFYNGGAIENVKEFKYLGIIFSRPGSFCKTKKKNIFVNKPREPCTVL